MPTQSRRSKDSASPVVSRFVRATRLHQDDWGAISGTTTAPIAWKVQSTTPANAHPAAETASIEGTTSSLANLLAGRILRDGEVVKLIIKPSLWFIAYQSFLFVVAVVGLLLAYNSLGKPFSQSSRTIYGEVVAVSVAFRIMLATLQWMGRYYLLTDQRLLRVSGVFNVEVKDCLLRKISAVQVTSSWYDRFLRIGNIDILSQVQPENPPTKLAEDTKPIAEIEVSLIWQNVPKPMEVQDKINDAIRRLHH